jgi:uncharacterized protein YukE
MSADGVTRTLPDGSVVYGSVQDGVFYSADGKLLIRPDGTVEHGFTDANNYFHSQRAVDGRVLYGLDTKDGGWISDDGKVFVDGQGKIEHGVSTPDGQFLPNGTTHKMPDGTVLYGFDTGGDFYSWDGTTVVLSDGTVLHGSTNLDTGVFTPANGDGVDVITDNGIFHGTYNPDGSIALSDGTKYMTPEAWAVDLPELLNAIAAVRREKETISGILAQIKSKMEWDIGYSWTSPAHDSFEPIRRWFLNATTDLMDILDEMISRMKTSYDNYLQAEETSLKNLTPGSAG